MPMMMTMTAMITPSTIRTRAERRHNNVRKAERKKRIAREVYPHEKEWDYYDNLHQYSKNKIHCSCPMCSAKTTNKRAKKVFYAPSWNPTMTDLRKEMAMDEDELEYLADAVFREKFSSRHNRRSRRR